MSTDWKQPTETIVPLLDCIIETYRLRVQLEGTLKCLLLLLDYSSLYCIAVGRVHRGVLKEV